MTSETKLWTYCAGGNL